MERHISAQRTTDKTWVSPSKAALRWKKVKWFAVKNLKEYCDNTTIHGLKYIADSKLFTLERTFFTVSFMCMALATTYYIYKIYENWLETPTIISLSSNPTWITQDPFPAVTICNMNQAYKQKAEQYSVYSVEYAMIQMICQREANATVASSITDWNNLPHLITEISQPCSKMLAHCKFGGVDYKCSEIFRPIVTNGGLCCVFNMAHLKFVITKPYPCDKCKLPNDTEYVYWSPENGYDEVLPKRFIPMPAAGTGGSLGLSITLDAEEQHYYCSSTNSIGFKILLHNPLDLPNIRDNGVVIAPGYETNVRVEAYKTETVQSLRSMDMSLRHCVFQDESNLKKFWVYTQRNCEYECLADLFLKYCGCIPHYMHTVFPNKTMCSIYEASCVEYVRYKSMIIKHMNDNSCPARCPPGCYDLSYMPIVFRTKLAHTGFMCAGVKNASYAYVEKNIARVHIYFKDHWYRSNVQSEYVGITDFLSSVGGIIGLFLGFSFISLAEIVYYVLLKPARILIFTQWAKYGRNTNARKQDALKVFTLPEKGSNLSNNKYQLKNLNPKQNPFAAKNKNLSQRGNVSWGPNVEYTP